MSKFDTVGFTVLGIICIAVICVAWGKAIALAF